MIVAIGDFSSLGNARNIFSQTGEDVFLFETEANPAMPGALGRHTDLQYCYIRRTGTLYCAKACPVPPIPHPGVRIATGSMIPQLPYPYDTICNISICGDYAIGSRKCTDPVLIEETEYAGLEWIDVRQGYAGCSCIAIDTGITAALITSDPGIARACTDRIHTLLLPPQEAIRLPGYLHGFIGGIGGLEGSTLYITGRLDRLASEELIRRFLADCGTVIVELSEEAPTDIGGLIFFSI
ncbi:MAG: DUF6873 family GME fold protein [Saccharofermentanales bacterium]